MSIHVYIYCEPVPIVDIAYNNMSSWSKFLLRIDATQNKHFNLTKTFDRFMTWALMVRSGSGYGSHSPLFN